MAVNYQISYINSALSEDEAGFVRECEEAYRAQVCEAGRLAAENGCKIFMLAGPSSAGKTTTASVLDEYFTSRGGEAYVVSLDDFYRIMNDVKPTMIRTSADEVTYCLHVILRYEMEKAIFREGTPVSELPSLWNDKMEALLGIRPQTDSEGILLCQR